MNDKCTKMNKWRDENGNRKAARVVPAVGSAAHVQKKLDEYAATSGWAEVEA